MKKAKKAFKYKKEYNDIISKATNEDHLHLMIKADSHDGGMATCEDLYNSLYTYETSGRKNVSPIYDFEMWYEKGIIKFFVHTKEKDAQLHLRKQLSVHFPESEFQTPEDKLINIDTDDYIVCANLQLKRPFFEPISTNNEPYENVFAELDNKDETKALIQHLFKPADPDWTDTIRESAEEYAERLRNQEKSIKGKFGLKKSKIQDSDASDQARLVENQVGEKGFNVRIRLIIANPNKRKLLETVKHLNNMYEIEFEAPSGQTLTMNTLNREKKVKKFIKELTAREAKNLSEYRGIIDSIKEIGNTFLPGNLYKKRLIMSSEELSNIAHIPTESDTPEAPISWSRIPSARIPPGLKDFPDLAQSNKKEIVDDMMKKRKEFRKKMRDQQGYDNNAG